MSSARAAYRDGWRRVVSSPVVWLGVVATLVAVSAPAAWLVREALVRTFGDSTIASGLVAGFDLQWYREITADADGLLSELAPSVIGFAAILRNTSDLVTGNPGGDSFLIVAIWFVVGTAISGGILDRYARQRPLHVHGFIAACGRTAFRLLRLNLIVLAIYAVVLGAASQIAEPAFGALTREETAERAAFFWYVLTVLAAGLIVTAITIVADCARVRLVVEDRRSALFSLVAGWRFARKKALTLTGLYARLIGTLVVWLVAYFVVTSLANLTASWALVGFAVGQAYLAGRVFIKLLTYAATTSLFQSELAHAGYVAAPAPVWPESPIVETLGMPGEESGATSAPGRSSH
jgi:hypothetical protein